MAKPSSKVYVSVWYKFFLFGKCNTFSDTDFHNILLFAIMATLSSILAWEILWTEEPGGVPSIASQRVGHDWATEQQRDIELCHENSVFIFSCDFIL